MAKVTALREDLTTKQSFQFALQRAIETQMVRLFDVWSANVHQVGEELATENFSRGLNKLAGARTTAVKIIDGLEDA